MYHGLCVSVPRQLLESVLFSHHVGLGNQTWVVSLGGECFYQLDHLTILIWFLLIGTKILFGGHPFLEEHFLMEVKPGRIDKLDKTRCSHS